MAPGGPFTLEFRGARLGQVLDYLSKQAGFVIANPVELAQPLTLVALTPVTPAEAVEALNGVLLAQGFAAIVRGKTLHIVPLPAARQQNLPVFVGADPERIPDSDAMVTQVIPVQFATVKDLAENLMPLLNNTSATLAANESSNTLILTDTQAHIRRIVAIVQGIDGTVSGDQQVRVFNLAHADAEKVATVISTLYASKQGANRNAQGQSPFAQMFSGGRTPGQVQSTASTTGSGGSTGRSGEVAAAADSGSNSVVVRASAATLEVLGQVVAQLDVDTSTRDGVLVYRVRNGKAADLAKSLTDLFSGSQTSTSNQRNTPQNRVVVQQAQPATTAASALDLNGQVRVVSDATSNSVLVLSAERNFERLRKILEDLDQPMRQVLVRVLVAEVSLQEGLDLGIELQGTLPHHSANGTVIRSNFGQGFDPGTSTLGMSGFLLSATDFKAAIHALSSDSRFDVLSRPYVLTTDNREAKVNVSQEVPIINGSRTDANNNLTYTFDRRDVGIILTVTPQINSEGSVLLDVSQELSALADQGILISKDVTTPVINKRMMTTRVVVDNGQTVVVGGLVHDELTESVKKVPLLGDIPWLGALFRRTVKTQTKRELLIFLTPQVVKDGQELNDLTTQLRGEMQRLDAAVEKGLLQRHIDQLMNLPLGQPITAVAPAGAP